MCDFWSRRRYGQTCLASLHSHRRITTNLKTKSTQNCQKIELYASPATKYLKKPYSSRKIGGLERGSQCRKNMVWHHRGNSSGRTVVPHSHEVYKNQEGYLGSQRSQPQARPHSPGFQHQKNKVS